MEPQIFDTIIIGGGAAGIAAAIYTVRKNLKVLMLTKNIGGQAALSGDVENYPGFTMITGADLAKQFRQELMNFENQGLWIKEGVEVIVLGGADPNFSVKTSDNKEYHGKTVIIASGRSPKMLGIPGEKELMGKGVATCATCLPPDESIIGNSSINSIKNITDNQRVLTRNGTYKPVLNTMKRFYEGDMVSIQTRFFSEPVLLTPNHPVLKCNITKGNWWTGYKNFKWSDPEWVSAGILRKGDIVLYPIIQETENKEFILISDFLDIKVDKNYLAYNKHETYTSRRIPNRIPLSKDFLRLAGYFLAEGSITRGINFYFHKKEQVYIDDVIQITKDVFNLTPTIRIEGNVARIEIFSKTIGQLFEQLFSKYSYNKKIPHFMIILNKNKQKELVKGFFRGDGCVRDKDFCLVTNSRTLTYQFRDILLRLGIIPLIQVRRLEQLKPSTINGREINFRHDKYHLVIGGVSLEPMSEVLGIKHPKIALRKRSHSFAWIKDGQALLPIKNISHEEFKGEVYNLAVKDSNTYVAKNFIVHNCDAPFYKDKDVAVVGGGNSALDAAFSLIKVARSVTVINITESLRGDEILLKNVTSSSRVKILNNHEALEILGDKAVGGIKIKNKTSGEEQVLTVSGVFIEIGWTPSTGFDKLTDKNDTGEIEVDEYGTTSVPGIYAAGDVNNIWGEQIVIAAGEGAKTGLRVAEHLSKVPHQATSNIHEG